MRLVFRSRVFPLLMAATAVFGIVLSMVGCEFGPHPAPEEEYRIQVDRGHIAGWREGKRSWQLAFSELTELEDNVYHMAGGIEGQLFRSGRVEYTIYGASMTYSKLEDEVKFRDGVRLVSRTGEVLTTESLIWMDREGLLRGPAPVEVEWEGGKYLRARSMEARVQEDTVDFHHIELRMGVHGR